MLNFTQMGYEGGQQHGQQFTYAPLYKVNLSAPKTSRADAHR